MNEKLHSASFPDAFYRVSVRGIVKEGNRFLLGKHKESGFWETFGGGLDFGEDLHQALRREVLEETGCEVLRISDRPVLAVPHIVHNRRGLDWFYNFPIYFEIEIDVTKFDLTKQYSEIRWFNAEELNDLNIFEGEEGIKERFISLY